METHAEQKCSPDPIEVSSQKNQQLARPLLSVVSPVYRAENIVEELAKRITEEVSLFCSDFEIVLVNDGSPDNSWEKIQVVCNANARVRGVNLSRNFGQHNAVRAGVEYARGEYIVIMDCDLQDNPKYIKDLLEQAQQGFEIVYTRKHSRKHSTIKNVNSQVFHWVFNVLTNTNSIDPHLSGFTIMSRKVGQQFLNFRESNKAYITILQWLGYRSTVIEVEHEERFEGESSYTFAVLLRHAINGLIANSDRLLYVAIYIGFVFFFFSLAATAILSGRYLLFGAAPGWTSLVALLLLCTGLILMCLGILGIYIGKVFDQVKERPLYVVDTVLQQPAVD